MFLGLWVVLHTPTFPASPVEHISSLARASMRYQLLYLRARCALAALLSASGAA